MKYPNQPQYYTRQVLQDITGGREYDPGYVRGELDEFLESYGNKDIAGVDEELQDVLYGTQMLAYQATKKDRPIYGADDKVREFYRRNAFLKDLLQRKGVPFSHDYTTGGTNFKKPEKIQAAFGLAGHQLPADEALQYSREFENFKGASWRKKTAEEIATAILKKLQR